MSEMVDRVAKAIREVNENTVGLTYTQLTKEMARAAIEAMREPTPKMVQVVSANWGRRTWAEYNEVIDAALQD